jgi:hypothetical protein
MQIVVCFVESSIHAHTPLKQLMPSLSMLYSKLKDRLLGIVVTTAGFPLSARIRFLISASRSAEVKSGFIAFSPIWDMIAAVTTVVEESNSCHRLETFVT